jgi:hypothetical protein
MAGLRCWTNRSDRDRKSESQDDDADDDEQRDRECLNDILWMSGGELEAPGTRPRGGVPVPNWLVAQHFDRTRSAHRCPGAPLPAGPTCARERAAVILPPLHGHGTGDVGWERRSVYRHTWEMVADQPLELL